MLGFYLDCYILILTLKDLVQILLYLFVNHLSNFTRHYYNYVLKFYPILILFSEKITKSKTLQDCLLLKEFLNFFKLDFFLTEFIYLNPFRIFFLNHWYLIKNLVKCFCFYLFFELIEFINQLKYLFSNLNPN